MKYITETDHFDTGDNIKITVDGSHDTALINDTMIVVMVQPSDSPSDVEARLTGLVKQIAREMEARAANIP